MRILIIGDLEGQFSNASLIASKNGARIAQVKDINLAIKNLLEGNGADLVMMHARDKIAEFKEKCQSEKIFLPIIACGFSENAKEAAQSIKNGAIEYLPLPPNEELIMSVLNSIAYNDKPLIYVSDEMKKIVTLLEKIASSNAPILISGSSGTGKEVLSQYIYRKSSRKNKQFIAINCAAIPENLLESELFGHEKGAFTGALNRRIGKFEESNGGTLLLDEISEIDIKLQAKLLRAIQEKEITRIGSNTPIKLDLRIIATTNRDLQEEVKNGRFREDLFFRLNVINVNIPPLKDRKDDLAILAKYFIEKYSNLNGLKILKLSDEALHSINSYDWPGNVREFENALYRAVLLSDGADQISKDDLMLNSTPNAEKDDILSIINQCKNNANAANILGISIKNLEKKLAEYEKV